MSSVQALWERRTLTAALASSEFKSRYRRLGLGVVWAVLNPVIQSLLIAVVFSRLGRGFGIFDFPYVLYVMSGMMPWNFFVNALQGGTNSLLESGQIVQRVAIPRAALPTANLIVNVLNFAFVVGTLLVITAVLAFDRMDRVWLLPAAVVLNVTLVYGMSLLTSSLQVRYRDVGQLVGAAIMAWFWVTPIVYPLSFLQNHPLILDLVRANPLTGVIGLYRTALVGLPLDPVATWSAVGWAALFLVGGWMVFTRREGTVADFL